MKKLILIIALTPALILNAQQTYIPDNNFETYLENNGMGNGVLNDDSVATANIIGVTNLNVELLNIFDLTGIEDFAALENLTCRSNMLTSLDLSQNTSLISLSCFLNQLTSLNLSQNTNLSWLDCSWNQIGALDVSYNLYFTHIYCSGNNLTSLDLSQNNNLTNLACHDNQLTCLNIKNGNNVNLLQLMTNNNSSLLCIEVDDENWAPPSWIAIDSFTDYSNDCDNSCSSNSVGYSDLLENINKILVYPNPSNGAFSVDLGDSYRSINVRVSDISGKLIISENHSNSQILNLDLNEPAGIYFITIESEEQIAVIRLMKQ